MEPASEPAPRQTGGRIDRDTHGPLHLRRQALCRPSPATRLPRRCSPSGVALFGRSFKYHRPRGVLAAGIDEPNALVTVLKGEIREPNIPATLLEIHDGLTVVSQNRFPSLAFDVGAVNQLAGKLISAGFYYKTFMGPVIGPLKGTRFWMFCEYFIRRAAGLGRAGYARDTGALRAHERLLRRAGGRLRPGRADGRQGCGRARPARHPGRTRPALRRHGQLVGRDHRRHAGGATGRPARSRNCPGAAMSGCSTAPPSGATTTTTCLPRLERVTDHKSVAGKGEPRHRHWSIRAGAVVLATGAFERPLVFPGNDRPGVMLAGAAERYANEFGVLPGDKVVLFTNNDSAYRAAAALTKAGGGVAAIVDVRAEISPARAQPRRRSRRANCCPAMPSSRPKAARRSRASRCRRFDAATRRAVRRRHASSTPTACWSRAAGRRSIHLASQAGGKPAWNDEVQAFLPPEPTQNWIGAGAFNGRFSTAEALAQGHAAGIAATGAPETPVYLPDVAGARARSASGSGVRDQGQGQGLRRLPA